MTTLTICGVNSGVGLTTYEKTLIGRRCMVINSESRGTIVQLLDPITHIDELGQYYWKNHFIYAEEIKEDKEYLAILNNL